MVTSTSPFIQRHGHATPSAGSIRVALGFAHGLVAGAALVGGIALMRDPSGAPMGLAITDLRGLGSFAFPGLVLVIMAGVEAFAAFTLIQPGVRGLVASQVGGGMLTLFTAFAAILIAPLQHWQPATFLLGAVIFVVAHELYARAPHAHILP